MKTFSRNYAERIKTMVEFRSLLLLVLDHLNGSINFYRSSSSTPPSSFLCFVPQSAHRFPDDVKFIYELSLSSSFPSSSFDHHLPLRNISNNDCWPNNINRFSFRWSESLRLKTNFFLKRRYTEKIFGSIKHRHVQTLIIKFSLLIVYLLSIFAFVQKI